MEKTLERGNNYTVRNLQSIQSDLRTMALKGRKGLVFENIKTKDLAEFITGISICMINLGICKQDTLNNALCIRKYQDEYTIIFMIKINKEQDVRYGNLDKLGCEIISFDNWVRLNRIA